MGKRSNKRQQQTRSQQPAKPQNRPITDSDKEEIKDLNTTSQELVKAEGVEPKAELSEEAQAKLESVEKQENLSLYWLYVKDINRNLEALRIKQDEREIALLEKEEELNAEKKEFDSERGDSKKRQEEINKKWQDLTKREQALLAGDYPESIKNILQELENASNEVQSATAEAVKNLGEQVKKHIKEIVKYGKSRAELDAQLQLLDAEKQKLDVEKKKLEKQQQNLDRIIEEKLDERYNEELDKLKDEVEGIQFKLEHTEKKFQISKEKLDGIKAKFGGTDPELILQISNELTEQVASLKEELESRPTEADLDSLKSMLVETEKIAEEFRDKVNEEQLLELRQRFQGQETFEFERKQLMDQVEAMRSRIGFMTQTVEEKDKMIEQLQGERNQTDETFEFVSRLDADVDNGMVLAKKKDGGIPKDLKALINYVQLRLANPSIDGIKPLRYDEHTLRTFLAGLHMSPMTLLTGISGTGKTSLAREFSRALISDKRYHERGNTPFEIVAVQSGWRDRSDLFGYFNSFEKRYKETDFFRALYRANLPKYRDTLFFIVLDEMNLSRPEHYFADFLSALEQSENERFIRLDGVPSEVYPEVIKVHDGALPIPPNVRFIGTANHDESTLEFAPKTIDRSNLMEMPKSAAKLDEGQTNSASINVSYSWLSEQFRRAEVEHMKDFKKFQDFIEKEDVKKLFGDMNLGAGNRLDDQAKRFIGVYVAAGGKLEEAADHLVTSRILRNLKDKYQFTGESLFNFQAEYNSMFGKHFVEGRSKPEPIIANSLLDEEMKKKEK